MAAKQAKRAPREKHRNAVGKRAAESAAARGSAGKRAKRARSEAQPSAVSRNLWAPWRSEYVEGARSESGCIFCDPPQAKPDRERLILHRGRHGIVRLNRFPYAAGHLMVSPVAHRARLSELAAEARAELLELLAQCERILEVEYRCEGLNVGANLGAAAGAGFADHLHFHLVPRWRGDVNFMTSIGEIRVIPAHIERSYERLLPSFQELGAR